MNRSTAILSKLLLSLPVAAGPLCAAPVAWAQDSQSVNIPFAFSANNHRMDAGHYQVRLVSDRFLYLRNANTARSEIMMVRPESGRAIETRGRLVFHRAAGRTYLTQVWIAGTSMHSEAVGRPKPASELAKRVEPAGSTAELALK
jgi:hypothetical protein